MYRLGGPGGLVLYTEDGKLVNADGTPIEGGTGASTWSELGGKPNVIAAGDTPQDARDAIGAVGTGDSRLGDARPPTPHQHAVEQLTDSTPLGRQLVTAASPSAARSAIGAGTSNLVIGAGAGQAATGVQGAKADTAVQPDQLDAALAALDLTDVMSQAPDVEARFLGFLAAHPTDPEIGDWWILLESG